MGGRLWLILFLLTVAIGVTIFMSGQKELPAEIPTADASLDTAPTKVKKLADDDPANAFTAPPTKGEIKAAEEAKTAADKKGSPADAKAPPENALPGTTETAPGSATALPSDASPYPGSAPGPAFPPPMYPGPGGPDGGFEGEMKEPPPEDGEFNPDFAPPPSEEGF